MGKAGGSLILNNGTINAGTNNYAVYNSGSFTMNSGTIAASNGYGVCNIGGKDNTRASFIMNDGNITAKNNGVEVIARQGVTLSDTNTPAAKAEIYDGTITAASGGCGVLIYCNGKTGSAELIVGKTGDASSNPSITVAGNGFAVSGNGTKNSTNDYGGTTITINSGTLTAKTDGLSENNLNEASVAIYHPQDGTLTINGGTIDGDTGVEIRSGTLSVTGGTITGNSTLYKSTANGNGNTAVGVGIAIAQHSTDQAITVNISGDDTKVTGYKALSVDNPNGRNSTNAINATISGGEFKSTVTDNGKTTGDALYDNDGRVKVEITGGKFDGNVTLTEDAKETQSEENSTGGLTISTAAKFKNGSATDKPTVPEGYVLQKGNDDYYSVVAIAQVGTTEYYTLADAIEEASKTGATDTTVKLLIDYTLSSATMATFDKSFTLDLNGKTLTTAETINIASGKEVTIKDSGTTTTTGEGDSATTTTTYGSIKAAGTTESPNSLTALISNSGTLNLDGVKLDGSNLGGSSAYVIANTTNGTLKVNNGANIVGGDSIGAIDNAAGMVTIGDTNKALDSITGNIFLSVGEGDSWKSGDGLILNAGTITDDLFLSKDAATLGAMDFVTLNNTASVFSANADIKQNATLLAYPSVSTATTYNVGVEGWYKDSTGENKWNHLTATSVASGATDNKLGEFNVILDNVSTIDTLTTVKFDDTNKVIDLNKDITVVSGTVPTASVGTANDYKVAIIEATASVASVKTYETSITITDSVYGDSITTITAASITSSTIGVNIVGNSNVTSIVGGSGADSLTAGNNDATLDGGAGNDSLVGGKSLSGGAGDDTLTAGSGGSTLDGGAGDDSLIGGNGNDLFVMNAGTDSISGYAEADTLQIATNATVTVDGNNVKFSVGTDSVLIVESAQDKFITSKAGESIKTARYYDDGAEVVKVDNEYILVFGENFKTSIATASKYTQTSGTVEKVSLSGVGANSITFNGFKEIDGFRAAADKVSVSAAPTDANIDGQALSVSLDANNTLKVNLSAALDDKKYVTITAGEKTYQVADGELITNNQVTLTNSYDTEKVYSVASSITAVDASSLTSSNSVNINAGSLTTAITLLGGAGNDTLTGGTGNNSLDGGKGDDLINVTGTTGSTVNVSVGNDTISVGNGVTSLKVENFNVNDVLKLTTAVNKIETIDGGIKAGNVSISGLNLSTVGDWTLSSNVACYAQTTLEGATLGADSLTVGYRERKESETTLIELGGISTKDGLTVDHTASVVSIGADNFVANGASISTNAGNYTFNLTAGAYGGKTFTGSDGKDSITILDGASGLAVNGGGDADVLTTSGTLVTLTGGAGNDFFVMSAGTATITDYNNADNDSDTIQFASAPTFAISGNDVTFADNFVVKDGKGKFITTKVNDATTVAAYYENASINSDAKTKLILGADFSGTATASDYTVDSASVTAVDASAATAKAITFAGFASINGFSASNHTLSGTPDDAAISGSDLVIALDNSSVTIAGAATSTINLISGETAYTASKGIITNATTKLVSLTGNYDTTAAYKVASDITKVTAARITSTDAKVTLDGSATNGVKLTGSSGADSIVGGTGADELTGGSGADTFVMSAGNDSITDFTADDSVQLLDNTTIATVDSGVQLKSSTDTTLIENTNFVAYIKSDNTAKFYDNLQAALSAGGSVTLLKEVTPSATLTISKDVTLDLNGFNITSTAGNALEVSSGTFEIKDSAETAGTISGNILLSGTGASFTLTKGTITGDLLLSKEAAEAGALKNFNITGGSFSGNADITVGNLSSLLAYQADTSNYKVGLVNHWYKDATTTTSWNHFNEVDANKLGKFDVTLNNVASIGSDTSVTVDSSSNVIGLGSDISINSGSTPTAKVGDTSNYNVAIITTPATDTASVKTYTNGVKITDTLYGGTVTKVTAAENTYGVNIAGNSNVTSIVGGSGADSLTAGNNDATLDGGAGNDSLVGGKSLSGGAGNDMLTAGSGGSTLDGGAGDDSLIGGNGNDLFVMNAGTDSISGYAEADTLQIATNATVTVNGNNVKFTSGTDSVLIVESAQDKFITSKAGESIKTARYYDDGAEVVKSGEEYILVLGENFTTSIATASKYTQTSGTVEKVSLSSVGANSITFNGFKEIDGFRAAADKVSVSAAPTDANLDGQALSVSLDANNTLKVNLSAALDDKKYVTITAGTTEYQVADGELITGGKATLTDNYADDKP